MKKWRIDGIARKRKTILVSQDTWSKSEPIAPESMSSLVEDLLDIFNEECSRRPHDRPSDVLFMMRKRAISVRTSTQAA